MEFVKTPGWLDWYSNPSKPKFKLPAGAVDAHCHVFGPGAQFPYAPERKYTPCDASKEQLFALRDHLGFDRNVIVQATCHGTDNCALVDALKASNNKARGVATVSRNVTDKELKDMHARALADIDVLSDVSVVVIRGDGKAFSAGVEVAAHTPDRVEEMLTKFHAVIRALRNMKKVTIAAVHGHCLGGGAELAMVCDMVYTSTTARWGFPEIKLGSYPPVACTALAALVGQKRAAELILTGRTISGSEAAEIGLANHSVAEEQLQGVVEGTVQQMLRLSPSSLSITKKAIYAWDAAHFDKGLVRAEKIYLEELMKTADAQEGIRAFIEKREPKWAAK